jgi:hypothetical protein
MSEREQVVDSHAHANRVLWFTCNDYTYKYPFSVLD